MTANSARMSRTHTQSKPKYQRWQRLSFNPGIVGRLCETPPDFAAATFSFFFFSSAFRLFRP